MIVWFLAVPLVVALAVITIVRLARSWRSARGTLGPPPRP
jgi:hypothetical protein